MQTQLKVNQSVQLSSLGLFHFKATVPKTDDRHIKETRGTVRKVFEGGVTVQRRGSKFIDYYDDTFWKESKEG